MFTNPRWPILDIAALKLAMRQKLNFQDGVARSPLITTDLAFLRWGARFNLSRLKVHVLHAKGFKIRGGKDSVVYTKYVLKTLCVTRGYSCTAPSLTFLVLRFAWELYKQVSKKFPSLEKHKLICCWQLDLMPCTLLSVNDWEARILDCGSGRC